MTAAARPEEFTPAMAEETLRYLHAVLAPAQGHSGKLVLTSFNNGMPAQIVHVQNEQGAADKIAAVLDTWRTKKWNSYFSLALYRDDLPEGSKGHEDDIVGVFGFVQDFDSKHNPASFRKRLPVDSSIVVESSAGNFQATILLDAPIPQKDAKLLAVALQRATGCDNVSKDTSHVWRPSGTWNRPNRKKIAEGRAPEPQPCREIECVDTWEPRITADALRAAILKAKPDAFDPKPAAKPAERPPNAQRIDMSEAEIKVHLYPEKEVDRSEKVAGFVWELRRRNYTIEEAIALACEHADSPVVERFDGDIERIAADIGRLWGKQSTRLIQDTSETFAHVGTSKSEVAPESEASPAPPADLLSGESPFSDSALSDYFAECHGHHLRFDEDHGRWRAFDGSAWIEVKQVRIWNLIKPHHRELVHYCTNLKTADKKSICSKAAIAAVEALSRGHKNLVVSQNVWDADPWLLNTPGGAVDLRTGELRSAVAADHCTKITAIAPDFETQCLRWRKFLVDITGGDTERQDYLQRVAGYSLTGSTREHVFFFAHGPGGNGKSVFFGTLRDIWADYAKAAPSELLMQSHNDRHPTELAMLQGARLVTMQETQRSGKWDEGKLKKLTGGDPVPARWMHGNFFEYVPQFKFMLAGNHKPHLENADEAMRRRLHLVPFTVTIPEAQRDPDLPEKLREEWPAILAWAIEGCLQWQRIGLLAPPAVKDATREYFEDQDPLSGWIEDRCVRNPEVSTAVADLFFDYETYLLRQRIAHETLRRFSERLDSYGFKRSREGKDRVRSFSGIALKEPHGSDGEVPL